MQGEIFAVGHVEVDESRNGNRRVESGMAVTYFKIVKYRHNDRIQSANNNNIQPVSNNLKLKKGLPTTRFTWIQPFERKRYSG